jgi:glycosyltransferase involved in cell wall biosynthesis
MHADTASAAATRGRVVMLVDNGVRGDSRVQKIARSAAEAGWDVVLLGVTYQDRPESWRLGGALVKLMPMPDPVTRASLVRRTVLRRLLRPAPGAAPRSVPPTQGTRAALVALARRVYRPWDELRTRFWLWFEGEVAWRRLEPNLWDFEDALGPAVDELAPDLIHAHDFRMLGVGARAKQRAAARGHRVRLVWDAHEFLPGVRPWRDNAHWLPAHRAYEREYARYADAVLTVSDPLAELLRTEHKLAELPTVVLNTPAGGPAEPNPEAEPDPERPRPELRAACGVGPQTPLVVYSGRVSPQRGLPLMVEALPRLPGVHAALVVDDSGGEYVRSALLHRAAELGVADRLHVLPYVPHSQVVRFLATAHAGVIPIEHWPNHEIALVTKFFEYSHARLPLVVSDVRVMAETVRATGQGEVFRAADVADYVRAVRAVLANPGRYRAAYDKPGLLDEWTWEAQAVKLDALYRRLTAPNRSARRRTTALGGSKA